VQTSDNTPIVIITNGFFIRPILPRNG